MYKSAKKQKSQSKGMVALPLAGSTALGTGVVASEKLVEAVQEGGFKDWGRVARRSAAESISPMVKAIKRDIALQRLGRIGKLGILAAPGVLGGAYLLKGDKGGGDYKAKRIAAVLDAIRNKL